MFFRKQETDRASSNLLVSGLIDQVDACYNILEVLIKLMLLITFLKYETLDFCVIAQKIRM